MGENRKHYLRLILGMSVNVREPDLKSRPRFDFYFVATLPYNSRKVTLSSRASVSL